MHPLSIRALAGALACLSLALGLSASPSARADGPVPLTIPASIERTEDFPFLSHQGPGEFDNTLALNVAYEPIRALRAPIEQTIGRELDFFKGWDPQGEAHVTTITPVEYHHVLQHKLTMTEIEAIAKELRIQSSDLRVLGLGSGKAEIGGKTEETFFLLVESINLRRIRQAVYDEFVRRGGDPSAFDPAWFFPHVTIGYTLRDLHEQNGVLKNIKHSWDPRFALKIEDRGPSFRGFRED